MTGQLILVVNTGSTTTKCSVYRDENGDWPVRVCSGTIEHPDDMVHRFSRISHQVDYREELVREYFAGSLPKGGTVAAVGALGGMLPPVPSGVIRLNRELADFSLNTPVYQHASNLGAPLSFRVAETFDVPSFVVDPVGVDEMDPIARISGAPDFPRFSFVHALNIRATVRKLAAELSIPFEKIRVVACHLGGGYSIAPLSGGRLIDSDNRMEGAPFTPERAGGVPPIPLLEACFSGKYSREQLFRKLYGAGGVYAYLGTKNVREMAGRAREGDTFAAFIYDAMIYQIVKEIGAMASVLDFDLDGIVVTGGVANGARLASEIERKCRKLAPVFVFPGENENEAIAASIQRVLRGREKPLLWPGCVLSPEETDPLFPHRDQRGEFSPVTGGFQEE